MGARGLVEFSKQSSRSGIHLSQRRLNQDLVASTQVQDDASVDGAVPRHVVPASADCERQAMAAREVERAGYP